MRKISRMIALLFWIVSLLFFGIGLQYLLAPGIPPEYARDVKARIAGFDVTPAPFTDHDGRPTNQYRTRVAYEAEGVAYESVLDFYDSGMHVGQILSIQYDARDPRIVTSPSGRIDGGIGAIGFGAIGIVLGFIIWRLEPTNMTIEIG